MQTTKVFGKTVLSNPANANPVAPEPESGIDIPHIKIKDNPKLLPTYTAALSKISENEVPAEDLDSIQLELELLLSNVALRNRVLKLEFEMLDKDDKKNDRRNKLNEKQISSPGKKKREDSKKHKLPPIKLTKQKANTAYSPSHNQNTDDSMDAVSHFSYKKENNNKAVLHKNDIPNKFWLSVEPYCMPITNEDLKLLDDLLEQRSGPLAPPAPNLGLHYTTMWALEAIKEEQSNSKFINTKSNAKQCSTTEPSALLQKGKQIMGERVTGPLTQRLVSALFEEHLFDEVASNTGSYSSSDDLNSNLRSLAKNGIQIEKRVKKELIEQGIFDNDDVIKQEDEVYSEIKRIAVELSAITEYNKNELRKLQDAAKLELKRLEVKRKLDLVDQKVLERQAKLKKKPLRDEEILEVSHFAAEQKMLADQLECTS